MAVHCKKFDEERAERVIKYSAQKLGYTYLRPEQLNVIMQLLSVRRYVCRFAYWIWETLICLPPFDI